MRDSKSSGRATASTAARVASAEAKNRRGEECNSKIEGGSVGERGHGRRGVGDGEDTTAMLLPGKPVEDGRYTRVISLDHHVAYYLYATKFIQSLQQCT